jgi:hypothetical protein
MAVTVTTAAFGRSAWRPPSSVRPLPWSSTRPLRLSLRRSWLSTLRRMPLTTRRHLIMVHRLPGTTTHRRLPITTRPRAPPITRRVHATTIVRLLRLTTVRLQPRLITARPRLPPITLRLRARTLPPAAPAYYVPRPLNTERRITTPRIRPLRAITTISAIASLDEERPVPGGSTPRTRTRKAVPDAAAAAHPAAVAGRDSRARLGERIVDAAAFVLAHGYGAAIGGRAAGAISSARSTMLRRKPALFVAVVHPPSSPAFAADVESLVSDLPESCGGSQVHPARGFCPSHRTESDARRGIGRFPNWRSRD